MKTIRRRIMIFEEVLPHDRWMIMYYLLNGREVYFIRLNKMSKTKKWVNGLIAKGGLKRFELGEYPHVVDGIFYDMAFDNMDHFFKESAKNALIVRAVKLYSNADIELAYKKSLNKRLARIYYVNHAMNKAQSAFIDSEILFIPFLGLDDYINPDGCEIHDYARFRELANRAKAEWRDTSRVKFPAWAAVISNINLFKRKAAWFIKFLGSMTWAAAASVRNHVSRMRGKKSFYKYALVVTSPRRQCVDTMQQIDFLIDGAAIHKNETVFLCINALEAKYRKFMEGLGLDYINDLDGFISFKELKDVMPFCGSLLASFLKDDIFFLDTALALTYLYIRWKSLVKHVEIEKLVSASDYGIQSIARNIVLSQAGCETFYYLDSINYGFFFSKGHSETKYRHDSNFIMYDNLITWNGTVADIFKKSKSKIENYINTGCFWAEHLRIIEERGISSDPRGYLPGHGYRDGMKLITVFDSGLHDYNITDYEYGISFLNDILKLLADLPDVFIILKEKNTRETHIMRSARPEEILGLYDKLDNHPRCYCIKNSWKNSSETMAFSDLVISFPFTSTTFEALSWRKKAIWYDAANKFSGTFYDQIPGLVSHGYDELIRKTNILLNMSQKEYGLYLDANIKGKVEDYLDGKAITRFRALLSKTV